jgi:predicted nucleic acid-binding protein
MQALFDTNVVIDAAVPSRTYHDVALELLSHVDRGTLNGFIAPASITTCWYVATTQYDVDPRPLFQTVAELFDLAAMTREALRKALQGEAGADFEDLYLAASAVEARAEIIVTRNERDFAGTGLEIHHPRDVVEELRSQ